MHVPKFYDADMTGGLIHQRVTAPGVGALVSAAKKAQCPLVHDCSCSVQHVTGEATSDSHA